MVAVKSRWPRLASICLDLRPRFVSICLDFVASICLDLRSNRDKFLTWNQHCQNGGQTQCQPIHSLLRDTLTHSPPLPSDRQTASFNEFLNRGRHSASGKCHFHHISASLCLCLSVSLSLCLSVSLSLSLSHPIHSLTPAILTARDLARVGPYPRPASSRGLTPLERAR